MQLPFSGVAAVTWIWSLLFLADLAVKRSKYGMQYIEILHKCGLTVSLAHFRWKTSKFNRWFVKMGRGKPRLLQLWFNCGVLFGGFAMLASMLILTGMLYKSLTEEKPEQLLTPVMPGMNLPWNQIVYYALALFVAGLLHEIGHAIAAVREQVRVQGFGAFLLVVYPGAFVELHSDQLAVVAPIRQLRIYCAGVWHNFVLALGSGLVCLSLPYLLAPIYIANDGLTVTWVNKESSVAHKLPVGDQITGVNGCLVSNLSDWHSCVSSIEVPGRLGHCMSRRTVAAQNTSTHLVFTNFGEPDCCNDTGFYRFCFSYEARVALRGASDVALVNGSVVGSKTRPPHLEHACLPARPTMSLTSCYKSGDCPSRSLGGGEALCLKPLTSNRTAVVKISHRHGQDILFVGHPSELISSLWLSIYYPKFFFCPLNLPDYVYRFSMYMLSISGALSILNMVPCYSLDGHFALVAFVEFFLGREPPSRTARTLLIYLILFMGTVVLVVNILLALYNLALS